MTLAQIGEFSFVIAGLALATGAAPPSLYAVAVAVSVITSLATPTLVRLADPVSTMIDRRLPRPVQTVVTLYESWIELMRRGTSEATTWHQIRRSLRWMFLDAAVIGGVIVVLSVFGTRVGVLLVDRGIPERTLTPLGVAIGFLILVPFAIGMVTSARRVAVRLAEAAMPTARRGVDQALAPRGVLVNVLQIGAVVVLGLPLLVITQPFLSVWPAAGGLGFLLLLLIVGFIRSARDLQGHARAGAELIVDVLARQGVDKDEHSMEKVQDLLPGMGTIVPFPVVPGSSAVGHALGELNLRGLTGVTVVALSRGAERIVFPDARQVLESGDVLALTGSHDALAAAHRLLSGPAPPPD
ncbi:MAG: TrkA C-terminal domain-containing protein [Gemmatimonadota bacterium]